MKNWEDLLRKRLSSYQEEGSPGQEDAIWNAIESQIAPAHSAPESGKSNSFGYWGRWAIGAAAVAGIIVGMIHSTGDNQQASDPNPKTAKVARVSEIEELASSSSLATPDDAKNIAGAQNLSPATPTAELDNPASTVNSKIQTQTQSIAPASNEPAFASTSLAPIIGNPTLHEIEPAQKAEAEADAIADERISKSGHTAMDDHASEAPNETGQLTRAPSVSLPSIPSTDQTELAEAREQNSALFEDDTRMKIKEDNASNNPSQAPPLMFLPQLNQQQEQFSSALVTQPQQEDLPVQIRMPFALRAYGGPTVSQFAFGDDRDPELNSYFLANIGAGGGLMVEFQKWSQSFAVGFAWNEFIQHLDYVEHTEYAVITEGIQSIQINEITGDTMAVITGDVEGIEQRSRYVSHYNRYRAFAIPLEWQKQQYFGPWQLGFGLGALIQFRSYAAGRTIGADGLVADYSDGNLSQTRINWMPTGRLFAGFFIAPEWRADLSISSGLQPFNNNSNVETQLDGAPAWQGRLVNGQVQIGVTRLFAARVQSD